MSFFMSVYPSCSACATHESHSTRVRGTETDRADASASPVVREEKEKSLMVQSNRAQTRMPAAIRMCIAENQESRSVTNVPQLTKI